MIEFLEQDHLYLVDGVITPSVSQIIKSVLDEYPNVPKHVLQNKAEYGTKVHELIERLEKGETLEELAVIASDEQRNSLVAYKAIREEHPFQIKDMEQIVGNERCCGRYDILTTDGMLIDLKTNARLPKRHLEIQLGLYYYLMGMESHAGACIWLPKKGKAKWVEVTPISNAECEEILKQYEETHVDTD